MLGILIFASIAAVILYKLWSVLGKRPDGGSADGTKPYAFIKEPVEKEPVKQPKHLRLVTTTPNTAETINPLYARIAGGLTAIRDIDPGFDPDAFVVGARQAFGIIIKAFADGDTVTLRPLLSDQVYGVFSALIKERLATSVYMETRIAELGEPELVDAGTDGTLAHLTVRFTSSQISFTRNADGQLLDGSPQTPAEHKDEWIFARDLTSDNPNWLLVSTETDPVA